MVIIFTMLLFHRTEDRFLSQRSLANHSTGYNTESTDKNKTAGKQAFLMFSPVILVILYSNILSNKKNDV